MSTVPGLRSALRIGIVVAGLAAVALWLPPREAANQSALAIGQAPNSASDTGRFASPAAPPLSPSGQVTATYEAALAAEQIILTAEQVTSSAQIVQSPPQRLPSAEPSDGMARPDLVRTLQRELSRLGCYGGEIDGSWGPGSKRAMALFVDRVNASLPTDEPDFILLSLVQSHKGTGCQERSADRGSLGQSGNEDQAPRQSARVPARSGFKYANEKSWSERAFDR